MPTFLLSDEDLALKAAFETGALAPAEFSHRAHVALAYVYLARGDVAAAVEDMRAGLAAYLRHHGIDQSKYHETLTRAWILAVWHFMSKTRDARSSADLIARNPMLLDSKIMLTHYSTALLFSDEARKAFVEPDLDPIPRPPGHRGHGRALRLTADAGRPVAPRVQVTIRPPVEDDMREFLAKVRKSRRLHRPWVAAPDTPARYRAYLERMAPAANYAFVVCRKSDHAIVGVINLSNVVRGLFQSGYLGYYAFAGHEGQGYMKEGLRAVIRHAFKVLKLHRLEANIQPGNVASRALVVACGFRQEGYSPRYLKIGGRWRDHERWTLLAS